MPLDLIIFMDEDGNIVDYVLQNNTSDFIFALARELSKIHGEKITPYYAKLEVGEEYTDKIHTDISATRPVISAKTPLDTCHQYGLCSDSSVRNTDLISRCQMCPRK